MASSEDIVSLYLAIADIGPDEAKANITQLSQRKIVDLIIIANQKGIQSRELKLLDFVRILGKYLTHEEPSQRKNGMKRLGEIPSDFDQ